MSATQSRCSSATRKINDEDMVALTSKAAPKDYEAVPDH